VSQLNDQERIHRARMAEQSIQFLDPAFDTLRAEYRERLTQISASAPWEANKISALANADRIVTEVRSQLVALIADGVDAKANQKRAERIEQLSPAKRRLLQIGAF
jgi:hypothetical protein